MTQVKFGGGDGREGTRKKLNDMFTEQYTSVASLTEAGTYADDQTLTAAECAGDTIFVTGAATITLPPVAVGMRVTITTIGAVAVRVDPNGTEAIIRNGTAQAGGVDIVNASTTGNTVTLQYYGAGTWYATSATFVAGS